MCWPETLELRTMIMIDLRVVLEGTADEKSHTGERKRKKGMRSRRQQSRVKSLLCGKSREWHVLVTFIHSHNGRLQ